MGRHSRSQRRQECTLVQLEDLRLGPCHVSKKLIDGARAFYREHLSRGALVQRWWGVFEVLRRRQQREPPRISSTTACTCDAGLLGRKAYKECSKCEITRKRGAEIGKFIGLGE